MKNAPSHVTRISRNYTQQEGSSSPQLSVVVPCYGVAEHVSRLLESLDAQDCDPTAVEIIFVIDGSPDNTEEIIANWMRNARFQVTLAWQENRGVAGALNTGNRLCRGSLINTTGADDALSENYLSEILQAGSDFPEVNLFVTRMIRLDASGTPKNHPLDFKFTGISDNTVVNLLTQPEMIHLAGGVITLKRTFLEDHALEYDERLRSTFEDAALIARYLMKQAEPMYMLLPRAQYFYWTREGSITSDIGLDYTGKLTTAKSAYVQLLDEVGGPCPQWLGNLLLYELYWIFRAHTYLNTSIFALSAEAQAEFDRISREVLKRIGLQTVQRFRVVTLPLDIRAAWEAAVDPRSVTHSAVKWAYDEVRQLQKVSFFSGRSIEAAAISLHGREIEPAFWHVREVSYFDKPWAYEHIYWIDVRGQMQWQNNLTFKALSPTINFTDAGRVFNFGELLEKLDAYQPDPPPLSNLYSSEQSQVIARKKRRSRRRLFKERLRLSAAYRAAGVLGWRRKFESAWVLMDSIDQANDNAEHLYRYIQSQRPDINAWFVNTRNSPDWKRLKAEGFRLISYNSVKHFALMKECSVLASSHLDDYVVQPFAQRFLPKTWTFSFLQHGVTKDRQDRWFNKKAIDHLVTSTEAETESISGEPSPYKFSRREVTLTGMPRHDRLYKLSEQASRNGIKIQRLLIMPTWRRHLSSLIADGKFDLLADSEYVQKWTEFLTGDHLRVLARRSDVEIVFLPHRGSAAYWQTVPLPSGVRLASYVGEDIQELIATATLTITDYSSQAFEGAFCNAPCIYFHFDRRSFFSGSHVYSPGYFDYSRDGFGPVAEDVDSLTQNIDLMLSGTHPNFAKYMQRIADLYPLKDGRASERVVTEIEKRLKPYSLS